MKQVDGWWFPDHERHLIDWMANPKGRKIINGRPAYQGKKQLAAIDLVPESRRRTAIDVGGHCGTWSWNLAHWFDTVEAFEPVPEHRECWEKNMQATPKGHVAHLWPCALGDKPGTVSIVTEKGSSGNSMVDVKGKGSVEMRTLDSFDFKDVNLIKIDTEGFEVFVLRGAEQTVKAWKPVIVVEQKRDHSSLHFGVPALSAVKLLQGWGYKVAQEISGDFLCVCS
jgi:FkbM family methyltransferase